MKVILLRDVAKIGRRYAVCDVPSGHAQNLLIPRGLAVPATPENLKRYQTIVYEKARHESARSDDFQATLRQLETETITLTRRANPDGHLYEGVHADDIEAALAAAGWSIERSAIRLPHPLKTTGSHTVTLNRGTATGAVTILINPA
jgi:large subunit ribosomal protein L9